MTAQAPSIVLPKVLSTLRGRRPVNCLIHEVSHHKHFYSRLRCVLDKREQKKVVHGK